MEKYKFENLTIRAQKHAKGILRRNVENYADMKVYNPAYEAMGYFITASGVSIARKKGVVTATALKGLSWENGHSEEAINRLTEKVRAKNDMPYYEELLDAIAYATTYADVSSIILIEPYIEWVKDVGQRFWQEILAIYKEYKRTNALQDYIDENNLRFTKGGDLWKE